MSNNTTTTTTTGLNMKKEVIKTKVELNTLDYAFVIDSQPQGAMTFKEYHDKVETVYTEMVMSVFEDTDISTKYEFSFGNSGEFGINLHLSDDVSICIEHDMGINYDMDIHFGKMQVILNRDVLVSIDYPYSEGLYEDLDHDKDLISIKSLENAIFNTGDFKRISDGKIKDFDSFLKHMPSILKNDLDSLFKIIVDMKEMILNSVDKENMIAKFRSENETFSLNRSATLELVKKFEIEEEKNKEYRFYQIKGSYYLLTTIYHDRSVFYDLFKKHSTNPYIDYYDEPLLKNIELTKLEIIHH